MIKSSLLSRVVIKTPINHCQSLLNAITKDERSYNGENAERTHEEHIGIPSLLVCFTERSNEFYLRERCIYPTDTKIFHTRRSKKALWIVWIYLRASQPRLSLRPRTRRLCQLWPRFSLSKRGNNEILMTRFKPLVAWVVVIIIRDVHYSLNEGKDNTLRPELWQWELSQLLLQSGPSLVPKYCSWHRKNQKIQYWLNRVQRYMQKNYVITISVLIVIISSFNRIHIKDNQLRMEWWSDAVEFWLSRPSLDGCFGSPFLFQGMKSSCFLRAP